jgi:Protein of unknown function (DUF3175)
MARKTTKRSSRKKRSTKTRRWSGAVTARSNALDLRRQVFTWKDPRRIAASLKRSAERSKRRKASPYQSAMSMLNFYINRAAKILAPRNGVCWRKRKTNSASSLDECEDTCGDVGAKQAIRILVSHTDRCLSLDSILLVRPCPGCSSGRC